MQLLTSRAADRTRKTVTPTPFFGVNPFVQTKLTVNTPGDVYEKEADATADRVMRKCSHCEEEEHTLQRKTGSNNAPTVSSQFAAQLGAQRGKGATLPKDTRQFMEKAFSADFSDVTIHTDSTGQDMSQEIHEKAFTHGNDIYFNEGQYAPATPAGKHLLAHELTHVLQQGGAGYPHIQRDEIDHRQLTWQDFKADVPPAPRFDAETSSNIRNLDLSKYPFKTLTEEETGTTIQSGDKTIDCEKGMAKDKKADEHPERYKAFKVNIEPDLSQLSVKAFMTQEKSWAKKWLYDPVARAAHAETFVPGCEAHFNKAQRSAEKSCNAQVKACEKAFKKNSNIQINFMDVTVTKAADCSPLIKPACVKSNMSTVTYQWKNQNGTAVDAGSLADCSTTFKQQLISNGLEDSSQSLLNHEQRHFDISHEVAEKITSELQTLASSFEVKEVEACSKGKALAKAGRILQAQRKQLTDKMRTLRSQLRTFQSTYDTETNHSKKTQAQDWWNRNIDAGLPQKSGKKDKFL